MDIKGDRLKLARNERGLTLQQAADLIGVKRNTVWLYEDNRVRPSDPVVNMMARIYDKRVEWFYGEESEQVKRVADGVATYAPTDHRGLEAELEPITLVAVNVVGTISAGGLVEAWQDDLGQIEVPRRVIRSAPRAFALKVAGNSLVSDGILDGDVAVVDPDADFVEGRIYAVRSEENNQTIAARRVYTSGGRHFKLVSGDGAVVEVEAAKTEILGRIRWSFSLREH